MDAKMKEEVKEAVQNRDVKSSSRKGNKPNRKQRRNSSKVKEDKMDYKKTRGSNDLAWHSPDVELLKRSAAVSWSYQTGELIDMNKPLYYDADATPIYAAQAGLLVLHDWITCGGAGYYNYNKSKEVLFSNPTYNAANTLLTEMRSRARLRNTYDAPDVFMLNMAMANIYAAVIFAKRLAGTVRMFTYENQYLPELLITAQGFDPNWFKINQYRFVTELNVIISEINKIYIPNRMHLFELINERFSNYYTEGSSIKDQLYVITPAMFNIYIENGTDWASELRPCMIMPGEINNFGSVGTGMSTKYTFGATYTGDTLLNTIRRMLENVLNDNATADITGDMQNCFGDNDRFYLPPADPGAVVVPVFDEEILETIHNSSCCPAVADDYWNYTSQNSADAFKIVQDPNDNSIGAFDAFDYGDKTSAKDRSILRAFAGHRLIDVHANPSDEKTFAITRMRSYSGTISEISNSSSWQVGMHFGADLICDYQYWTYIISSGNRSTLCRGFTSVGVEFYDAIRLESFHYRPMTIPINNTTGDRFSTWVMGETDIFALIDESMMKNMNRISLLTLLGAYNNI